MCERNSPVDTEITEERGRRCSRHQRTDALKPLEDPMTEQVDDTRRL